MASATLTDQSRLLAGLTHDIPFTVLEAGLVTIRTVPDHRPKSDAGLLGLLTLSRPDGGKPVAQAFGKVADAAILIRHQVTAEEAAIPGEWICELTNESDEQVTFATQITGPVGQTTPQTASMDLGFINQLLAQATSIADVHLHAESGPPGANSFVSWSPSMTSLLNGLPAFYFHIDDFTKLDIRFHLKSLDSDPQYPRVLLLTEPLRLSATVQFLPDIQIETDPGPDITIDTLQVGIDVGFDGNLYPNCHAHATLNFNGLDLSDRLQSGILDAMTQALHASPTPGQYTYPEAVRGYLDKFFSKLLRLDHGAQIRNYRADQQTLFVDYVVPPPSQQQPAPAMAAAMAN